MTPLMVPELLTEIVIHCNLPTRLQFALTCKFVKDAVDDVHHRTVSMQLQQFIPKADTNDFWDVMNKTHAVIGGSFVTSLVFANANNNPIGNLNILLPVGELPALMTFFYQLDYNNVIRCPVGDGYSTTTSTIRHMKHVINVSPLAYI